MRRLLGIICLFRGHKPAPCPCILCRTGAFSLYAHHCLRCGVLVGLCPWDEVTVEWVDDADLEVR